jgi:hypothetical protein
MSRLLEVGCTLDLARTAEDFYAHLELDGVEPGPGDTVRLHDAPADLGAGVRAVRRGRATVVRAGWLGRAAAYMDGLLSLTELFEVSFSTAALSKPTARRNP